MSDNKEIDLLVQQYGLDMDNPTVKAALTVLKETTTDPEKHEQVLRRVVASTFNLSTPEEVDQKLSELRKENPTYPRGLTPGLIVYDDLAFTEEKEWSAPGEMLKPFPDASDPGRLYMMGKNIPPAPKTEEDPEGVDVIPNSALLQGMNFSAVGELPASQWTGGSRRGTMGWIDSLSEMTTQQRPVNEEVLLVTFIQGGKSKATWRGKTLEERTAGDWTVTSRMQIIRMALISAWKTKFKEKMPADLNVSVSMEGHFSFGGNLNSRAVASKIPTGKHSGGKTQQRNKSKRRK